MKIYVASNFANKVQVRRASRTLQRAGHETVQTWTEEDCNTPMAAAGERDLDELSLAGLLLVLNLPGCASPGRGTLFEAGYAVAREIPVILAGKRADQTFLELPEIIRVKTLKEAIRWIREHFLIHGNLLTPHMAPSTG